MGWIHGSHTEITVGFVSGVRGNGCICFWPTDVLVKIPLFVSCFPLFLLNGLVFKSFCVLSSRDDDVVKFSVLLQL